jgi:DNA topoisomerase-2
MQRQDRDIIDLMRKRVFDMAGVIGGSVKVFLNGEKIPVQGFSSYVDMYLSVQGKTNSEG